MTKKPDEVVLIDSSALQADDCFWVSVPRLVHVSLRDPQTHKDHEFVLTVKQARVFAQRLNDAVAIIAEELFDKTKDERNAAGAEVAKRHV